MKHITVRTRALCALSALCLVAVPRLTAQDTAAAPADSTAATAPAAQSATPAKPAPAQAQQQPTPAVATVSPENPDDNSTVVVLNPFTVSAQNEGYQAVDTLGGARVATKLADTPSALQVITKKFLEDTGATDAQSLLVYTTNTQVAGLGGNYSGVSARGIGVSSNAEAARLANPESANRARGISALDNTRNYFSTEIPWDSFNISRVDISRGPNSFLFGVGSPAGIANYSTNEAVFKNEGNVETRYGSFGSTRESLDYNRVLVPGQLAVRIDLLNNDTQFRQKPAFNHTKRAYAALRYDPKLFDTPTSHMEITANAEAGRVRSNNPRELPPMDFISGYTSTNRTGYDPFIYNGNTMLTGVGSYVGAGSATPEPPALSPWVNGQDYHYIWPGPNAAYWYDGTSGALLQAMTTLNGPKDVNGNGISSLPQSMAMYTSGFSNYVKTLNYLSLVNGQDTAASVYHGAYAGTVFYNDKSLTDPSIFDFYNKLIDGPNKQEWQNWKAFNVTVAESLFSGRLSFQGVADHQQFDQGQVGIFGYTEPFISVDMDAYSIMYPSWYPSLAVKNPNAGRPFTASDTGSGANSTSYSHDNYQLMGNYDLRTSDFLHGLAAEIFGHHSFTALVGRYTTDIEDRSWNTYATDTTFAAAMGDPYGSLTGYRGIDWVAYLGPSLANAASLSGANLSGINNPITPVSGSTLNFNNTWIAPASVSPSAPWTDPSPYASNPSTQAENPANYKGWTAMPVNVLNWQNDINDLYTGGTKIQQVLTSASLMYQGHMLDDTVIPEVGWRRDTISQTSANAPLDPNTHVASMNYGITGAATKFNTTSTSWGLTLHLPKSIRANLPLGTDLSVYYFRGNNETPKVRYAFDATELPSETGRTSDYGVQLDTLNGRATVRLTLFKEDDRSALAGSGAADPLGNNGYYLYLLPAWGAADAAASGMQLAGMNTNGFANNTGSIADQQAAVTAFKNTFAQYFPQSFFNAYGLGVNPAALSSGNWTSVYNNPAAFAASPYPWTIANTGGGKINGSFPVITQDVQAKGFELEATLRPLRNWDITFNATKVNSAQTALGAQDSAFIEKEYQFFTSAAGDLPLWGYWGGAGGGTSTLKSYFLSNIWSAYQLQQAQTGTQAPELSKWMFNGVTNYTFDRGALKGFNVGGGVRWFSAPILGYGITETTDALGNPVWSMDAHKPLYGLSETHFDCWVGYQHPLSSHVTWRVQLNLKNVGEHVHLVPVSVEPDGSYAQQRISEGQTFEISNKFMF